jgi:glycopeptide antibiotics resistance protein
LSATADYPLPILPQKKKHLRKQVKLCKRIGTKNLKKKYRPPNKIKKQANTKMKFIEKNTPKNCKPIQIMFIFYALFLIWAILFKFHLPFIGDGTERVINLEPFKANTVAEKRFNLLIFVPLGFYISAVSPKWALLKGLFLALATSTAFEGLQYLLAIGRSDITDVILNTVGGVFGVLFFYILVALCRKNSKIPLILSSVAISCICFGVIVIVLLHNKIGDIHSFEIYDNIETFLGLT